MMVGNQAEMVSCYPVQFPNMAAENKKSRCTLKFKVTTKGIWNASEDKSREGSDGHRDIGTGKHPQSAALVKASKLANTGKRIPEMSLDGQRYKIQKTVPKDKSCEGTEAQRHRVTFSEPCEETVSANLGKLRPEMSLDVQRWKKQKMDRNLKLECGKILKELMSHNFGWVFNDPVDPVKLMIPDYFEIIKYPMDLRTIKHKLEGNMYFDAKEFADDVKLTFENAKSYNPPSHDVHRWAEILNAKFSRRWKFLDTKLKHTNKTGEGANFNNHTGCTTGKDPKQVTEKNYQVTKPAGLARAPMPDKLGNSKQIPLEERKKSKPGLMQIKPEKTALNGCSSFNKTAEKGHCSQRTSSSTNLRLRKSIDSTEAKCLSCFCWICHCPKISAAQTSASDISSEKSSEHNHYGDSKHDCEVKCTLASLANSSAPEFNGPAVVLGEEKSPYSTCATTLVEGWVDARMSPKKALRAAMLKSRFADTIFRATHQTLLNNGATQQESLRLEKEQQKEKAKIEAEIKAAEAASRKEQDKLKMGREREREAARMALENIEKTVDIDNDASIFKDLEMLIGVRMGYPNSKQLERLGLYMKDRYLEDDVEEGEIMS